VRLKAEGTDKYLNKLIEFQFQFGAIKSKILKKVIEFLINFNSNLVRLKEELVFCSVIIFPGFQFQFGAIKSISECYKSDPAGSFQFQFGAIKR